MDNMICRICGQPISLIKDNFEISSLEGCAHTDCIKRKEHEDWRNSIKKLLKVDELEQENQVLKERWQKLKESVVDTLKHDREFFELTENDMYYDFSIADQIILGRMQELEKEQTNADL